jgi:hypothetical protein
MVEICCQTDAIQAVSKITPYGNAIAWRDWRCMTSRRIGQNPTTSRQVTSGGGRGGKGAAGGEHRWGTHAPDQSRNQHVPVFGGVRWANCSLVCLAR